MIFSTWFRVEKIVNYRNCLFVSAILCGSIQAAAIAPCGSCWELFNPSTAVDSTGNAGSPYFVNESQDGPKQGLAFQVGSTPLLYQTSGKPAPADAPSQFYFLNVPGHALQAQFLMGVTQDSLEFGWYDVMNPGNRSALFTRTGSPSSGNVTPTGTVNFTPADQFGFYVKYLNVGIPGNICNAMISSGAFSMYSPASCYDPAKVPLLTTNQIVYTQSGLNSTGPDSEIAWERIAQNVPSAMTPYHQHFVALQDPQTGAFIVGMEDAFGRDSVNNRGPLPSSIYEGNGDYQDFFVKFQDPAAASTASVPEPATCALLGAGLIVIGARRVRSRRAKS